MRTFFIIGAQRSGTTSLTRVLERDPRIVLLGGRPPEHRLFLRHSDPQRALDELMSHGAQKPEAQWVGSKATTYLERPLAAQRIFTVAPNSKIIVLLRDPIARAISNFHYTSAHGLEHLPIDEALRPQSQNRPWDRASISTNPFAYLDRGRYGAFLGPWLTCFPNTSVFILEELISGSDSLARLGDEMSINIEDFSLAYTHENQADAQGEGPSVDTIASLREFFHEPQCQLERMLGREISSWR